MNCDDSAAAYRTLLRTAFLLLGHFVWKKDSSNLIFYPQTLLLTVHHNSKNFLKEAANYTVSSVEYAGVSPTFCGRFCLKKEKPRLALANLKAMLLSVLYSFYLQFVLPRLKCYDQTKQFDFCFRSTYSASFPF